MAQTGLSYEWSMYYGADYETRKRAIELRKSMTRSEQILWEKVRKKQIAGYKFRRQHPIEFFIADFYCHQLRLVIEIDGEVHSSGDQKEWDRNRKARMEEFGIRELRFSNSQIENNVTEVLNQIEKKCKEIRQEQILFRKE